MDIQPSGCNGILIVVYECASIRCLNRHSVDLLPVCGRCGDLKIDDDANPLKYSQTFHILPTQQGSWWVHNDLFRLNIG